MVGENRGRFSMRGISIHRQRGAHKADSDGAVGIDRLPLLEYLPSISIQALTEITLI